MSMQGCRFIRGLKRAVSRIARMLSNSSIGEEGAKGVSLNGAKISEIRDDFPDPFDPILTVA